MATETMTINRTNYGLTVWDESSGEQIEIRLDMDATTIPGTHISLVQVQAEIDAHLAALRDALAGYFSPGITVQLWRVNGGVAPLVNIP